MREFHGWKDKETGMDCITGGAWWAREIRLDDLRKAIMRRDREILRLASEVERLKEELDKLQT